MSNMLEAKRKLHAIRTLSSPRPAATAEARLEKIADIATGKISPEIFINITSPDLAERLARGQASRSPRTALDKRPVAEVKAEKKAEVGEGEETEEKKRKKRGGHDRMESGGFDRSSDLHK